MPNEIDLANPDTGKEAYPIETFKRYRCDGTGGIRIHILGETRELSYPVGDCTAAEIAAHFNQQLGWNHFSPHGDEIVVPLYDTSTPKAFEIL